MGKHSGQVYERNIELDSAAKAEATKSFDAGAGWSRLPYPDSHKYCQSSNLEPLLD
ncbi:hypothetical protein AWB65_04090 [Caballeronia humi]|uniref:Uncharacterized protein n=1 Tax=Caballeronia humi TaxID=326474 RepID=A0A158I176_9BURK|nr:hypothetical protein AWB65_04090 [Caballeronia humi]